MNFKKSGGKIFGVAFSKKEQEAIDKEIRRQVLEQEEDIQQRDDAAVLYTLMTVFGFGEIRLRRFYESFLSVHEDLVKHYQMESTDGTWIVQEKLKQKGFDFERWADEWKKKQEGDK